MSNSNFPPVEIATLSEEQKRGSTCARCGRVPLSPQSFDGTDLVVCADEHARICTDSVFWLTQPCPWWCDSGWHSDDDRGADRRHMSEWTGNVPLVLEDGDRMGNGLPYQPEYATVHLLQGVREIEPRIWCGKGETNHGWYMTPAETRELAATLTSAAEMAERQVAPATAAIAC
ncbi:DUF6907 domain-containing protein [Amycolatopsis keratiniphila]|uniref:DUF6907 domain-containing protein n=1 Tax=Amycolatopsis keratiniphila TaxID=129921 RepID=UPI00373FD805